jgi:16S rRNA A1518/A1519 N6-dimethyltransferase RsmA/KsgA/DIM1 with predicted DNA glycosylase/AP lyase activity
MSEVSRIKDDEFAVSPSGIHIGHTKTEVDYLLEVIERNQPQGFIEVGVHVGGLADTVIPQIPNYMGIEIDATIINNALRNRIASDPTSSLLIADAWTSETWTRCGLWMADKRPVFIYCDGGKKPIELN